jgi:drug/metabolite transporter (DMT)-like permease
VLGFLFGLGQALSWASTTIILRSLSSELDAFLVNGLRAIAGGVLIVLLVFLTGATGDYRLLTATRLLYLIGSVAIGGVIGDVFYVSSLKTLGVSRAFPITNSYPLFTILFSALFLDEQIGWTVIAGAVLVMGGVYLLARPRGRVEDVNGLALSKARLIKGTLQALITAALWGINTVILSVGVKGINGAVALSVRVPAVVLLCLVAATVRGKLGSVRRLKKGTILRLIGSGVLGWGISGWLYTRTLQLAGPSRAAIFGATAPLFAVPLSMIFLHEKPTRYVLVGTVLSALGIVLVVL